MSEQLSRSARRVQAALLAAGIEARVQELPASTRSAQEAADALGCSVDQIAKSIVFRRVDTGAPVIVVLRGVDRVDTARLAGVLGTEVERADAEFVRSATGYAIGGVPPLGHEPQVQTVLDSALLGYQTVWAAAGNPQAVFSVDPRRLAAAARLEVASVAEQSQATASPEARSSGAAGSP